MAENTTSEDKGPGEKTSFEWSLLVSKEGLCVTCRHAEGCALPGSLNGPVNLCEEFDVLGLVRAGLRERFRSTPNTRPKARRVGTLQEGLCMDCRGRESCTFPRPEGGVWHCEEYE